MIEKKKDRTKDAPTPKAPQNRFTKNQWLNFRKFKVEKGKTMPFADCRGLIEIHLHFRCSRATMNLHC